jgi:hypothetical protein
MENEVEIPFTRGHLIDRLTVLDYHKRTSSMIKTLDEQIKHLEEEIGSPDAKQWKNPREETSYLHDVKTLSVLKRQRERLEQKLTELEKRVREDIEVSKELTPLKPLQ